MRAALSTVNGTIQRIGAQLGSIGASQSRLSVALSTRQVMQENFLAAQSRIMDANIAEESAELTRQSIIQRTAASLLAQANQQPSFILSLLRRS